jgi:Dullard-like phosphatase family protein
MIKNHFHQIIKEITNPLLNIFEIFIKEEINLNYPELITMNLRPDFNEHYNKLHKNKKFTQNYKNSEFINLISKNLDKCVNSMKYYSTLNLKYSTIKPFGDALNQLLFSLDRKTLNQFSIIVLNTLLFGELDVNRNKSMQNCMVSNLNKNMGNIQMGSSIINNIKEFAPFLPAINPKYKYTLVLDMDETLIHYFFTHINGMFFVRPYCFDFLRELNDIYEIVTFTAGTKDYADNILNILDIDNNIIKYRLYRQHTTILGCSVYKDLSKLGRDLSKVIIIDNLKENFKMQPNNGIFIKTWTNDINDVQFKDLLKILKDIVSFNVSDVRPVIQKMNDEIKISRNMIRPYANINVSKLIG